MLLLLSPSSKLLVPVVGLFSLMNPLVIMNTFMILPS
jgi:hypothetical protein